MTSHKWKKDSDGTESCERDGCTVRRFRKVDVWMWQRQKGARWRPLSLTNPIPPCAGKEAGEVKREWHGCTNPAGHSFADGVCEEDGCAMDLRTPSERAEQVRHEQPATSPLEVVRAYLEDVKGFSAFAYDVRRAEECLRAIATLEESIRADEREKCAEQVEDMFVGCHRMAEACGRDAAKALRNRQ